ncbi:MAG TPA: orotidine-5'-phosphate decarboxylase [Candidatus Binataceae bacterium]|nr:orotidine-5'-phosphate decarboxylase [Candidatus Binataceae bacterium]
MTQNWPFSSLIRRGSLRERLIVSLDLGTPREALALVDELARVVGMFKVGKSLYLTGGPDFVREIKRRGGEVFLDLKFHDAAPVLARAAIEATRLGVKMFDLHLPSGLDAIDRVRAEVTRVCRAEGRRRPLMVAVAMLASVAPARPGAVELHRCVAHLARLAADAALDGVITSPRETARVRAECGRRFTIISSGLGRGPGWRSAETWLGAAEAVRAGADYLVVGSPVWRATQPLIAVRDLTDEMERGLRASPNFPLELYPLRPV